MHEEDARFCEGCGGSLARTCEAIGLDGEDAAFAYPEERVRAEGSPPSGQIG